MTEGKVITFPHDDDDMSCLNCAFSVFVSGDNNPGQCRLNPPTVIAIPQSHPVTGQIQIMMQSAFPMVTKDVYCHAYEDKHNPENDPEH